MFPPQSTPSKRPKRRVESYRIYKCPYSACSQSSKPSLSSYKKATHGKLEGPTLSTPRGDKYYNQYRPLSEVCPRDRGKEVGTLQGVMKVHLNIQKYVQIVIKVRNRLNVQTYEICENCFKGAQPLKCTKMCNLHISNAHIAYFCTFKRLCAFKTASIPIPRLAIL